MYVLLNEIWKKIKIAYAQSTCGAGIECCGADLDDEKRCTTALIANGDVKCQWCGKQGKCALGSFFGVARDQMDGAPECSSANSLFASSVIIIITLFSTIFLR